MRLEDKTALVTGSSRGIGRAIALALAREGADVAVHCRQERSQGKQVVEQIRAMGRRATLLQADLARADSAGPLVQQTIEELEGLDILVNNAGIAVFSGFFEATLEEWQEAMDVNARSLLLLGQAAGRHMKERGGGKIINVTSISGERVTSTQQIVYCTSKAAANMLTRAMAAALAPHNIQVNGVLPGTVETDINRQQLADPQIRDGIIERTPAGRLGLPEDIAEIVVHLAGGGTEWVNGAMITVDGGYLL